MLILILFIILVFLLYWSHRHTLLNQSRGYGRILFGIRLLIVSLITLAIMSPTWMGTTHETTFVFLVDRSRSMTPETSRKVDEFLASFFDIHSKNSCLILPFAETPSSAYRPGEFASLPTDPDWVNQTNLEEAVKTAEALIPARHAAQLVLLSDGHETVGQVLHGIDERSFPISCVTFSDQGLPEVLLHRMKIPEHIRSGEPFEMEVELQSNVATSVFLNLYLNGVKVDSRNMEVEPGETTIRFRRNAGSDRESYSVLLLAEQDNVSENNRVSGTVHPLGNIRAFLLDHHPESMADFVFALREQEIEVVPHGTAELLVDSRVLEGYDLVILSELAAADFSEEQMLLIRNYVRDQGGGLLMLGSERSFGPGGFHKTAIEEVLPVRCEFEQEQEKPALALALVLDRSASMGGPKMELAKEAARSAVELLAERDYISVIAFDSQSHLVCTIQKAEQKEELIKTISTIEAAGGTNIYPALTEAWQQLRHVAAPLKHIILLTDGHSIPGNDRELLETFASEKITVTTIGIGDADYELLESIAKRGGGRHYACTNPQSIPQVFSRETVLAGRTAIQEFPFLPKLLDYDETLKGMDLLDFPPLLGYVSTEAKENARIILTAENESGKMEPLLVRTRSGLGVSFAFTSDAKGRWAAEWLDWPGYTLFWAQLIRQAARRHEELHAVLKPIISDGKTELILDLTHEDGSFHNEAKIEGILQSPDGKEHRLNFRQTAPGRYEAASVTRQPGEYYVSVQYVDKKEELQRLTRSWTVGYSKELQLRPANEQLLRQLAARSGGRFNPTIEELAQQSSERKTPLPLRPWLFLAALLLYPVDLFMRRMGK